MKALDDNNILSIKLLPLEVEHAGDLKNTCTGVQNSSMWQYLFDKEYFENVGMEGLLKSFLSDKDQSINFAIYDNTTNLIIGVIRAVGLDNKNKSCEIRTWIGTKYQGKRYGVIAKYLLLKYLFSELSMHRVEFFADSKNHISLASLESIGAKREGLLREHKKVFGESRVRSSVVFSILSDEWPAAKNKIERKVRSNQCSEGQVSYPVA